MRDPMIDVAVNIVRDGAGRVLMAERTARQLSAGFWELPGGKVDPGESPPAAAVRELAEEIGIEALAVKPWIRYDHAYRTRRLRLYFFQIERWSGQPSGREGQRLAWVDPARPDVAPILPSVERVLIGLGLPPVYALGRSIREIRELLDRGLQLIRICAPQMTPDQRVMFARQVDVLARPYGARVLLSGSVLEARRAGLSAIHSSSEDLERLSVRPPVKFWVTSCRNAEGLERAATLGADAAVVSSIESIGWDGLEKLTAKASIPVYAGGVTQSHLAKAHGAGAVGVATHAA